jgi:hypothetical protein
MPHRKDVAFLFTPYSLSSIFARHHLPVWILKIYPAGLI